MLFIEWGSPSIKQQRKTHLYSGPYEDKCFNMVEDGVMVPQVPTRGIPYLQCPAVGEKLVVDE